MKDYRKEVEEDIIYHYMLQQQRKSESIVSPVRIEQFYKENKDQFYQEDSVHLRLIQLTHNDGETDRSCRPRPRRSSPGSLGREVRGPCQGVQRGHPPQQGRRLGLAETDRPQARVRRAALRPEEGRMHRADHHHRRLLPPLRRGPQVCRHPAPRPGARPDREHAEHAR